MVLGGRIRLLVPEGVRVDVTGRTVLTTRDLRARPASEGPTIEVAGTMIFGSVRARAPKLPLRTRVRNRLMRGR